MDKMIYILFLVFTVLPGSVWAQSGEGGGVYLESGGKLVGSLVFDNYSAEGFGVAGEDAILLNCTVNVNKAEKKIKKGIKPGDILCADGRVVDGDAYKVMVDKNAIGVVFWVNSDVYSESPRMYVTALREADKKWGNNGLLGVGYERPEADTACYGITEKMLKAGGSDWEAADYCAGFKASGQPEGIRWAFPAAYQMAMLFANLAVVNRTLALLKTFSPDVQLLEGEIYWSSTQPDNAFHSDCAWLVSFDLSDERNNAGKFQYVNMYRNTVHTVRPVLVY